MNIKGTQLFIKALAAEKTDLLFAYPGSAVISLFDELYQQQDIRIILPRHEQALVHQADGYARSTGKTGVCLVTSGPGATNIVTGIATANYDSVPLVCFCGQVKRALIGNDAFQEVDIVGITRGITKHSMMVTERENLGKAIKEAFYIASTGRPGPVVVDLPVDMMEEYGSDEYPETVQIRSYREVGAPPKDQIKEAAAMLSNAKRPLFLIGGGLKKSKAEQRFGQLVEQSGIPVVSTIMGKGGIPSTHPCYIGNVGMHGCYAGNHAVMKCDLLCSIGCRFNDRITGKTDLFAPAAKIIHIDIDDASISRNVAVTVPIVSDADQAVEQLMAEMTPGDYNVWWHQISQWRQDSAAESPADETIFTPAAIIRTIDNMFEELIVVTDVGQHQMWTAQYLHQNDKKQMITSGGLGTMGFGFPAALGAKLGNYDKVVVCITGDGGFQMNLQELATAVMEKISVIVVIMNNQSLGMVRQWQNLMYGRRYAGTDLMSSNQGQQQVSDYIPDFIRLGESYGINGIRVSDQSQLEKALEDASKAIAAPYIIECMIDPDQLVLPMVKGGRSLDEMIVEEK